MSVPERPISPFVPRLPDDEPPAPIPFPVSNMPARDDNRSIRRPPHSGDVVPSRPRRAAPPIDEMPSDEDVERFGDVTRTCPECKKEVFDDAAVCYHCGHAFERTAAGSSKAPRWVVITIIVIVVTFVVGALSNVLWLFR